MESYLNLVQFVVLCIKTWCYVIKILDHFTLKDKWPMQRLHDYINMLGAPVANLIPLIPLIVCGLSTGCFLSPSSTYINSSQVSFIQLRQITTGHFSHRTGLDCTLCTHQCKQQTLHGSLIVIFLQSIPLISAPCKNKITQTKIIRLGGNSHCVCLFLTF